MQAAAVDLVRDRVLDVETPENVRIEYPLAGLGTRFTALLIDAVLIGLLLVAVPLIVIVPLGALDLMTGGIALAFVLIWFFLLFWGWFLWFEAFRDGQTPGKRLLSIRVVMEDGTPVTFEAAVIRNLLRLVDVQPFPGCLVGGVFMLLGGKSRRLGDVAAGTVVVREQPVEFPRIEELKTASGPPRLDDERFAVLETFAEQQRELEPQARVRIAASLAVTLGAALAEDPGRSSIERLLALHADESARRRSARLFLKSGSPAATALLRSKRSRWEAFRLEVAGLRGRGIRRLDEGAVAGFAARYRELAADLARARTYGASAGTLWALERLAGAAHGLFYRPVERPFARAGRFFGGGFPRLVRRLRLPIGLAALLLYGTGALTWSLATTDPEIERLLAPAAIVERAEKAREPGADYRDTWGEVWLGSEYLSTAIIANNVQVSFFLFIGGASAGLLSIAVLVVNGVLLGTALAVFANRGVLANLGTFVLPHGFLELAAIAIAGGAGLWMGSALLLPGRQRRLDAFAARARDAVALIGGVIAMLVAAGLIEGFLSPARIPAPIKVLAGVVFAAATLHYLLAVGRGGEPDRRRAGAAAETTATRAAPVPTTVPAA